MLDLLARPATALAYLSVAFVMVFLWPTVRLRMKSGVNAFVLAKGGSAEAIVSRWFKATMAALFITLLMATFLTAPWDQLGAIELPWPMVRLIAGWIILALALLIITLAQAHMGSSWRIGIDEKTTPLRENGLFAYSRNPIFLGMRAILLGLFLIMPNAVSFAILLLGETLMQIQVRFEEVHLERLHGQRYTDYRLRVRRWL